MIYAEWSNTPFPAWSGIEHLMCDDSGVAVPDGDYICVYNNDIMAGAFLVKPWTMYCWEIHGGVNKRFWGRGVEICYEAAAHLFRTTPCIKLVAIIPEFNRLMIRCVEKNGMVQEGRITKSFLRDMKMYDQLVYGVSRPVGGVQCQQQRSGQQ